MNSYRSLLVGIIFLSSASAQDAIYDSSSERVYIPSVRIGGEFYARVVLELDENDRFYLVRYDKASEAEDEMLSRIDIDNCFNAHPVAKLQAFQYFGNPDKSLCLRFNTGTGTEGGALISYLLIESGVAILVSDNRQVGFSACCLEIHNNITSIEAGLINSGVFEPWQADDPIDLEANYILRVELSGTFQTDL